MAHIIADQLYLDLIFNGESFPFDAAGSLNFVHIHEGVSFGLPMVSISVQDNSGWLSSRGYLKDGTTISVVYSSDSSHAARRKTLKLRYTNSQSKPSQGGTNVTVDAILDAPKFLAATSCDSTRATSTAVLSSVADELGFTYDGVGTADEQVWHGAGRTTSQFVHYVADHGYANDHSCMQVAITWNGVLRYLDITAMGDPQHNLVMGRFGGGVVPVTAYEPEESPGGVNLYSNYQRVGVEHSLAKRGDGLHRKHKVAKTRVDESGSLAVDAATKGKIRQGRTDHYPISSGQNSHDAFHRAQYQNQRIGFTFSSRVAVTVPVASEVNVLDVVLLSLDNGQPIDGAATTRYSGVYRVVRKITYVTPNFLVEKLILARRTTDSQSPRSAKTEDPTPKVLNQVASTIAAPVQPTFEDIPANSALANFTLPNLSAIKDAAIAVSGVVLAAVAAVSAAQVGALNNAVTEAKTTTNFEPLLNALVAAITDLGTYAAADVDSIQATTADPTTEASAVSTRVAQFNSDMAAKIAADTPAVQAAAKKALALAESAEDLASLATDQTSANTMTGSASNMASAASGQMSAADAAALNAGVSSGAASAAASATAASTAATTDLAAIKTRAQGWQAEVDAAKAAAIAAVTAAQATP